MNSFFTNTLFIPILKTKLISVKKPFVVLTCIVTTSFVGKKLDYKCTCIHHPSSDLGALNLGILFLFGGPFSISLLPLIPHKFFLLLYLSTILPKGFADLCTSFLGHSPHQYPLHTPVTKVCPVISQKTSKMVHAPRMCSWRHVHKILHPWP